MITSKLPNVGNTIFTTMNQLAAEQNAINLGQGFPEFNPDPQLIALVNKAMLDGFNQYPYMPGVAPLREAIAHKIKKLYRHDYNAATEITVTNGATEAIMSAILCSVNKDDEVIVLEPCYDAYLPCIQLAGGIPVYVSLDVNESGRFSIDWEKIENAITKRTKLLILNFPHNPTGITLKEEDLTQIENILNKHNILLIADEVYEHIVFDKAHFLSLSSKENIAAKTFVISSFGKTYHTTGWKVGYCAAPAKLTKEFRKVHQFVVFTVCSPMQYAFADYIQDESTYSGLSAFYQKKYTIMYDGLLQTRFKPLKSDGTFFLLANYSDISTKDEFSFANELTIQHKVGLIPVSAFYNNPNSKEANNSLVRFCFAKSDNTLHEALARLTKV